MRLVALLLLALAWPARADPVISAGPGTVTVTIYRDPNRSADSAMDRDNLNGFALVTETRTVDLPAGPAELRFENVVGGILPQSVIVRGLPGGTIEKDRDAKLLSPGLLLDAHLGRRVHLVRTNPGTGTAMQEDAIVRATNDGVVIQDKVGIEALGCSGLPERLTYDAVPGDLSAHPTLAVTTVTPQATRATVTLSYLATEFDWQANYVATLRPDGQKLDLVGWMTLANANHESLPHAALLAVAGRLNTGDMGAPPIESAPIRLQCWPRVAVAPAIASPPAIVPLAAPMAMRAINDVVVTGMRKEAVLEALGDLKLYRFPEPVTVAAVATKQVGLLHADGVHVTRLYKADIEAGGDIDADDDNPLAIVLRTKNLKVNGLGQPLPLGQLDLFAPAAGTRLLLAEGSVSNLAVGEDWDIPAGSTSQVRLTARGDPKDNARRSVSVINANDAAVKIEVSLRLGDGSHIQGAKLRLKNGRPLWAVTIPANGSATLHYQVQDAG